MKKSFILSLAFLFLTLTANCQLNRKDINIVFSEFLKNSFDGRYLGFTGSGNDSLRLDPIDYEDKVRSYNKLFRLVKSEKCFFVKSYHIDSTEVFADHAFGYVTLDIASYGYVLNRLPVMLLKIRKIYLLITKSQNWYVLSETGDWFISLKAYINWAEKYLPDMTLNNEAEYKNNVIKNLKDFKELIKTP